MEKRRGRTMYKEVEHDVEIEVGDVLEFIEHYADDLDLKRISQSVIKAGVDTISIGALFEDRGMEGTMVRNEKLELLSAAFRKFSLEELEAKLGTKYSLL
jgi:hypothetical protein